MIHLVEKDLKTGTLVINASLFNSGPLRQRIIYTMNMNKTVQHLWDFIKPE